MQRRKLNRYCLIILFLLCIVPGHTSLFALHLPPAKRTRNIENEAYAQQKRLRLDSASQDQLNNNLINVCLELHKGQHLSDAEQAALVHKMHTLLRQGADPNVPLNPPIDVALDVPLDNTYHIFPTVLFLMADTQIPAAVRLLLDYGANKDIINNAGDLAADLAAKNYAKAILLKNTDISNSTALTNKLAIYKILQQLVPNPTWQEHLIIKHGNLLQQSGFHELGFHVPSRTTKKKLFPTAQINAEQIGKITQNSLIEDRELSFKEWQKTHAFNRWILEHALPEQFQINNPSDTTEEIESQKLPPELIDFIEQLVDEN